MLATMLLLVSVVCAQQIIYYVNGQTGSDGNTGLSVNQAFATIDHARAIVRNSTNGNCGSVTKPILVSVAGGTAGHQMFYFLSAPLIFSGTGSPNDNGCSPTLPVVYFVPAGQTAVLSGGLLVTGNAWTCPRDPAAPQAGDVCTAAPPGLVNTEGLFYDTDANRLAGTARRFRPRLGGSGIGAQYRIAGQATGGSLNCAAPPCLDRFQYTASDPIASFLNFNRAGGACNVGSGTGAFPSRDIEIVSNEKWTEQHQRLCDSDLVNHNILLTGSVPAGGNSGYFTGHRYYIENVLTGADIPSSLAPGDWYLDRRQAQFVLSYDVQTGENPHTDAIIVPQTTPAVISLNSLQNTYFYGFTMAHDNTVVPSNGFGFQQNAYNIEPNEFFKCVNCQSVHLVGNTITQTVGLGVAFTTDATGVSNDLWFHSNGCYDLGLGCVYMGQFVPSVSDTDNNVVTSGIIRNNICRGSGRRFAGEACFAVLMSHDIHTDHNEASYTYGTGFTFCIPTPANCHGGSTSTGLMRTMARYNLAHHISQGVLGDSSAAGLYMASYYSLGNGFVGNVVHDVSGPQKQDPAGVATPPGFGGNGLYNDNVTCCTLDMNNLVYRTSWSCWQNTRTPQNPYQPNIVRNNILAFCANGIFNLEFQAPIGPNGQPVTQLVATHNYIQFDKTYSSPIPFTMLQKCGPTNPVAGLIKNSQMLDKNLYYNPTVDIADPSYTTFTNRTEATCNFVSTLTWNAWQALPDDVRSLVSPFGTQPFVNPFYPTDNFTLAAAPQLGFVAFNYLVAGVDSHNQPAVPASIPDTRVIDPYDPAVDF